MKKIDITSQIMSNLAAVGIITTYHPTQYVFTATIKEDLSMVAYVCPINNNWLVRGRRKGQLASYEVANIASRGASAEVVANAIQAAYKEVEANA